MDEFVNRLQQLIDYLGVTPILLADRMGVQRSTFSHLFSGRNKPGFEFLLKLQQVYPEVNLHWLISGTGSMTISFTDNFSQPEKKQEEIYEPGSLFNNIFTQTPKEEPAREPEKPPVITDENEQEISRMILIYTNGKMVEIKRKG